MKAKNGRIRTGIQSFRRNLRQFGVVLSWLVIDSDWRFRIRCVLVLVVGFFGATLKASAVGLILYYARALERGKIVRLLGQRFDPRTSVTLLCIFAAAVLATLLISAGMIFYARSRSLKLGCIYQGMCSKRVFELLSTSHKIWMPGPMQLAGDKEMTRMAGNDSRFCGLVIRTLLSGVIPTITFFAFLFMLVYIDLRATAIVLGFAGIWIMFLYWISRLGARSSRLFEGYTSASGDEKRTMLKSLTGISLCHDDRSWLDAVYESGETRRMLQSYEKRLVVVEYSRLLGEIMTAALMCAILLYLGGRALVEGHGWGVLIAYLVVLRQTVASVQQLSQAATRISRFYPQATRYRDFVNSTRVKLPDQPPEPSAYELTVKGEALPESGTRWTLKLGGRLGLISPTALTRYAIASIVNSLLPDRDDDQQEMLAATWFGTARYGAPLVPLRTFLGLAPEATWSDLIAELEPTGLAEKVDQALPHDLDSPLPPELWGLYTPDVTFALALLTAVRSRRAVIVLEEEGLRALPVQARERFLTQLSGRMVIIVHSRNIEAAGEYGEDALAVIDGTRVVGLGSAQWAEKHRDLIVQIVGPIREASAGAEEREEEEEDLAEG